MTDYEGEQLFDAETTAKLVKFAELTANKLKIYAPDDADHWEQFEDIADINIWQFPDEQRLKAAAYLLTGNAEDGFDTDTSKWQRLFDVRNTAYNYTSEPFSFGEVKL